MAVRLNINCISQLDSSELDFHAMVPLLSVQLWVVKTEGSLNLNQSIDHVDTYGQVKSFTYLTRDYYDRDKVVGLG